MSLIATIFFSAIAIVFVLEGIMPFLIPHIWRRMMLAAAHQSDKSLRIFGLVLMLIGLVILYIIHH